jgi:hypothetical protein
MQGLPSAILGDQRELACLPEASASNPIQAYSLFVNAAKGLSSLQLSLARPCVKWLKHMRTRFYGARSARRQLQVSIVLVVVLALAAVALAMLAWLDRPALAGPSSTSKNKCPSRRGNFTGHSRLT